MFLKYRTLEATLAKNIPKIDANIFGILLAFLPNTILIIFQNCQKVRNCYFSLEFYLQCQHM